MEREKPLKISLRLAGGKGSIIPGGAIENLTIEIIDNIASFHFIDCKTTKLFAFRQNRDGVKSYYNERLKKTISNYPNTKKEEILKHIQERLKDLGAKYGGR